MILETAVRDGKLMQDLELESLCNGVGHSQMVKDHPIANDSGSRDCVKLPSPTAVSRMIIGAINILNLSFYITLFALMSATILSYLSWLGICTEMCGKAHSYRLYDLTFEIIGMVYFPMLVATHLISKYKPFFKTVTSLMICAGIGAEILFIYVQKYLIGHFCPLCLSIAFMLLIAALSIFIPYTSKLFQKGLTMPNIFKGKLHAAMIATGFFISLAGLGQHNELQAEEANVKQEISFGNANSAIDVYIFTDWLCPACEALEPAFEQAIASADARFTFVDDPVHEATLNYTPYNLAFMVNSKMKYFSLRKAMHELANDTKAPTQDQIASMASKNGATLKELNYGTVAVASKFFEELIKKYKVEGTPTIVIVNSKTSHIKKLEGFPQIDKDKILNAIKALK